MSHWKSSGWIGFEEAQKSINSLKQEVEIVENKLHVAKRSFYKETKYKDPETLSVTSKERKKDSHFFLDTVPVHPNTVNSWKENLIVPNRLHSSIFEEEPNLVPIQLPTARTLFLEQTHIKRIVDSSSSTSNGSSLTTYAKHSSASSEGTASLIANAYKDAGKVFERHDVKVTPSEFLSTSSTKTSIKEPNIKNSKATMTSCDKAKQFTSVESNMEWKPVIQNKAFIQSRLKPDGIQNIRELIKRQKKKQEIYQMQLHNQLSSTLEQGKYNRNKVVYDENPVVSPPMRKSRLVKSLPVYKGFSAPPNATFNGAKRHFHNSKHTFVASPSCWKQSTKTTESQNKDELVPEMVVNGCSKTSEGIPSENKDLDTILKISDRKAQDNGPKMCSSSRISKVCDGEDSGNSDIGDEKTEITPFSEDCSPSKAMYDDINSVKENARPLKARSTKRKANKPLEQKPLSPKIRHYDVNEVRNYIKKKKEEHRKRHQDEHTRQLYQAQKKRESLEKLYEYQKTVAKMKPLSPIKIVQKENIYSKEHENQPVENSPKDEHVKDLVASRVSMVKEKKTLCSGLGDNAKRYQNEIIQIEDFLDSNSRRSLKKKHDNVHIDISVSKFISEHGNLSSLSTAQRSYPSIKSNNSVLLASSLSIAKEKKHKKRLGINTSASKPVLHENSVNDDGVPNSVKAHVGPKQKPSNQETIDFFRSISSVSTPSELSEIAGFSAQMMRGVRSSKMSVPQRKADECKMLKDMIRSLNVSIKTFEPLLRVKKWVEDSSKPPETLLKNPLSVAEHVLVEPEKSCNVEESHREKNTDVSTLQSQRSNFIEAVAGIGDVSKLYERILGRKPNPQQSPNIGDEGLTLLQQADSEDELVEGSLNSVGEEFAIQPRLFSDTSPCSISSCHFSDIQKAKVPNPFNLINTYARKPLGLIIDKEVTSSVMSPKFSTPNIQLEEFYKSHLNHNQLNEDTIPSTPEKTEEFLNSDLSETPEKISDVSFAFSNNNIGDETYTSDFSQMVEKPSARKMEKPFNSNFSKTIEKQTAPSYTLSMPQTMEESLNLNLNQTVEKVFVLSHSLSVHETVDKSDISNSRQTVEKPSILTYDVPSIDKSVSERGSPPPTATTINSLDESVSSHRSLLVEAAVYSPADRNSVQKSKSLNDRGILDSDSLLVSPELFHSDNSVILKEGNMLEKSLNGNGSNVVSEELNLEKNLEETESKENLLDRGSVSGSSVSEVISVVENSKGFRSSVEDLLLDKTLTPSKLYVASKHSSLKMKLAVSGEETSTSVKIEANSNSIDQQSALLSSDRGSQQSGMKVPSIPSESQNSVAVDVKQSLRWMRSNEGLEVQEDQYLHTQVVTRVASEAAAAAAASAVMAVLETQKALLAEKNFLGVINSYARSSSRNRNQYSSDFESSLHAKSASSSRSSTAASKQSKSEVSQDINRSEGPVDSNGGSIEKIMDLGGCKLMKSSLPMFTPNKLIETEEHNSSVPSEENIALSKKPPQRSELKTSGNVSSPSPASLSDNDSTSSGRILSSHSNFSCQSDSSLSNDSFAQLTLNVVRRMTYEEELRARHQLSMLQFQEKTVVEKARDEMMWLDLIKKKLGEKGADRKVSAVKHRQKELIQRLRQERAHLRCMQEAYRIICEKHQSMENKRKLLSSKDEKSFSSNHSESRTKEIQKSKFTFSSTPIVVSKNEPKTIADEESVSEVSEMLKVIASNSSQESIMEIQESEKAQTSLSSQNKSMQNSPSALFSSLNGQSLHSKHSLENALLGLKKLEASKRHLTKREQRIVQRRKQVENLLQWQMKLDSEEMAVRELEQKAIDLVDNSKKRIKYYVSSSGSAAFEDIQRTESTQELSSVSSKYLSKRLDLSPAVIPKKSMIKISQSSCKIIPCAFPSEENTKSQRESYSSGDQSSLLPEEIKSASPESSIQTAEVTENGSQRDESIPDETSYSISPSSKEKSSSSDVYSESFESSTSRKTAVHGQGSIQKEGGPGIRLPLVPRNLRRRHDSSGSDDSLTISQSETASDQSDIEVRIHALFEELKRRKAEADKLKREHKKKQREQLREKELSLQKQLEAYDQYIQQTKLELDQTIESTTSSPDVVVKPRIKWPRPEQVVDSRRVQKQAVLGHELSVLEKKSETVCLSPENGQASVSPVKDKGMTVLKKLILDTAFKAENDSVVIRETSMNIQDSKEISEKSVNSIDISDKSTVDSKEISEKSTLESKEISEKSTLDSKEISEILFQNSSLGTHELSEHEHSKSVLTEISQELKESSEIIENLSVASSSLIVPDESKSVNSEQKFSSVISSADENKGTDESQSHSDTFVSESESSKNSESSISNKTHHTSSSDKIVSSEIDVSSQTSKEPTDLSLKIISCEMSEESISEVQSASSEKLDNKDLNKISICSGSEGCEITNKQRIDETFAVHDKQAEHINNSVKINTDRSVIVLVNEDPSASLFVRYKTKLSTSEPFIVNIVNYLSASLFNDTLELFLSVTNQKGILGQFVSSKCIKQKVLSQAERDNEKLIEDFTKSLFDTYFEESFQTIFKIMQDLKSYLSSELNSEKSPCDKQSINKNSLKGSNNNILIDVFPKVENSCEFLDKDNLLIQDINENQIFTKEANWGADSFVSSQKEQQFQLLEQQLALQQYSYYYRKIPNKPPPPYTPPSSSLTSLDVTFTVEKSVQKSTSVKEITKNISQLLDLILDSMLEERRKGLALSDILHCTNVIGEKLDFSVSHQIVFMDLVFDLTKEIIVEQYNECDQEPELWLRPQRLTPKPVFPSSKESMAIFLQRELKEALKLDPFDGKQSKKTLWSSMKLGRKKRDFVDTILIGELKEEEPDWVNYDQDEMTVKLQIADSIFNVLIEDTIKWVKGLESEISS